MNSGFVFNQDFPDAKLTLVNKTLLLTHGLLFHVVFHVSFCKCVIKSAQ